LLLLILSLAFLFGTAIMTGTTFALQTIGRLQAKEEFKKHTRIFFIQHLVRALFGMQEWEGLLFSLSFTRQVFQLCYALSSIFFLLGLYPFSQVLVFQGPDTILIQWGWGIATAGVIIFAAFIVDLGARLAATARPHLFFALFCGLASLLLLLPFPFSYLGLKCLKKLLPEAKERGSSSPTTRIRDKILEIIHESELAPHLDPQEQKLIASVASFKERIAREIMVPRIDVFSLPSETTIAEAAQSFVKEGYSRIPVYRESVDHVIGVLLYKDVLNIYAQASMEESARQQLTAPIEGLVKPVLYTPETKKISHLLQEFRSKQIHLAIVVDEYGGTEGIVTIEDILEELVGEIADEYDVGEETLFTALPGGGWAVDARMGIIDIEKELGVKIPMSPEYDTIGGYIFHRAGAIPSIGWRIHQDDFDLEVLSSDERSIEKIKVVPHY
jgi:CBS domain containing-hemolysin-like protein